MCVVGHGYGGLGGVGVQVVHVCSWSWLWWVGWGMDAGGACV